MCVHANGTRRNLVVALLLCCLTGGGVRAGVWYVDASAAGPNHDGTAWCTGFTDLHDALAVASPGDEIRVADGVYKPDRGTGDRSASFVLKNGVTLLGGYAGCGEPDPDARDTSLYPSVLSGDLDGDDGPDFTNYADNSYHVVTYNDPNATGVILDGFTITSGNADGTGAGLTNQGSGIHIRNGAAKCVPGGPTIRNCIVEKNWSAHHGAVNDHALSTVIDNCIIRNNRSGTEGSGLQIHSGAPTVTSTLFESNVSDGEGGGAWMGVDTDATCTGPAHPVFADCTFSFNQAARGGGLFNNGTEVTVSEATFNNNRATAQFPEDRLGGGMYNAGSSQVTVTDSRFELNHAFYGGGIYNDGATVSVQATTFLGNNTPGGGQQDATGAIIFPGGGGLYATHGTELTLADCLLDQNIANRYGGTLYADQDSVVDIRRCTLSNSASYWNAIFCGASTLRVADSEFFGNRGNYGMTLGGPVTAVFKRCRFHDNFTMDHHGGVIHHISGTLHMADCEFLQNGAVEAGGALSTSGTFATIANCIFRGNYVPDNPDALGGGAISFEQFAGAINVTNCTFADNTASVGSAIAMLQSQSADELYSDPLFIRQSAVGEAQAAVNEGAATLHVRNSILWGAATPIHEDVAGSVIVEYSDVQGGWAGAGNRNADPLFDDSTLELLPGSPCIGTGRNDLIESDLTDLDDDEDFLEPLPIDYSGNPRVLGFVDMGAFEQNDDCNGNGIFDEIDLAEGTSPDGNGNGIPDDCEVPPPFVAAAGGRYVVLTVPSPLFGIPVAVEVTSQAFPCMLGYVQSNGLIGTDPVFQSPQEWGGFAILGREIVPQTSYQIRLVSEDGLLDQVADVLTARWGDTAGRFMAGQWTPPDGQIGLSDVLAALQAFGESATAPPLEWADIAPEVPDGKVDLRDINGILQAFANLPYPYGVPCE